jgi:hypothetical protein
MWAPVRPRPAQPRGSAEDEPPKRPSHARDAAVKANGYDDLGPILDQVTAGDQVSPSSWVQRANKSRGEVTVTDAAGSIASLGRYWLHRSDWATGSRRLSRDPPTSAFVLQTLEAGIDLAQFSENLVVWPVRFDETVGDERGNQGDEADADEHDDDCCDPPAGRVR